MKSTVTKTRTHINKLYSILTHHNILKTVGRGMYFNDEPRLHFYAAILGKGNRSFFDDEYTFEAENRHVKGTSFDSREKALVRCLGEAAERACLCSYMPRQIHIESASSIDTPHFDIDKFSNSNTLKRDRKIGWVRGNELLEKYDVLLPAQLIFLNYKNNHPNEPLVEEVVSTGAAAGFSKRAAMLRGVYEVIERDAIMVRYLTKKPGVHVDMSSISSEKIQVLYALTSRYKLQWYLFDMTVDTEVPVYLSIVIDETDGGPKIVTGSCADMNHENAIIHSLEEALSIRPWLRHVLFDSAYSKAGKPNHISSFLDRGMYWAGEEKTDKINWLLKAKKCNISLSKPKKKSNLLQSIISTLKKNGWNIYYCDITSPVFDKVGLKIVKIIIPGLQSLYVEEASKEKFVHHKRLRQFIGDAKSKLDINTYPHPFL